MKLFISYLILSCLLRISYSVCARFVFIMDKMCRLASWGVAPRSVYVVVQPVEVGEVGILHQTSYHSSLPIGGRLRSDGCRLGIKIQLYPVDIVCH